MNIDNSNFILKPKNDYVFKKIFGDERNKDILIAFLKAILNKLLTVDIIISQLSNSLLSFIQLTHSDINSWISIFLEKV